MNGKDIEVLLSFKAQAVSLRLEKEIKKFKQLTSASCVDKHDKLLVGTVLARKGRMKTHGHILEAQKPQLRSCNENRVVDCQCNGYWVPYQRRRKYSFGLF